MAAVEKTGNITLMVSEETTSDQTARNIFTKSIALKRKTRGQRRKSKMFCQIGKKFMVRQCTFFEDISPADRGKRKQARVELKR